MAKRLDVEVLRGQTAADAVPELLKTAHYDRSLIIDSLAGAIVAHVAGRVVESQNGIYGADPVESAKLLLDLAMRADVALCAGRVGRN